MPLVSHKTKFIAASIICATIFFSRQYSTFEQKVTNHERPSSSNTMNQRTLIWYSKTFCITKSQQNKQTTGSSQSPPTSIYIEPIQRRNTADILHSTTTQMPLTLSLPSFTTVTNHMEMILSTYIFIYICQ